MPTPLNAQSANRGTLLLLLVGAFLLAYIPFVHVPFSWAMTFFHEISHGLAALLTGGSIVSIELHRDGSGLCYTRGGWLFIIFNAGYIGAVFWGVLIYTLANRTGGGQGKAKIIALLIAGLIAVSAVLYAKDLMTWIVSAVLVVLFIAVIKLGQTIWGQWLLKFIGIYVLVSAMRAPLHLLDGRHDGDGASLADLTHIPEIIWVLLWLAIGVLGLIVVWRIQGNRQYASAKKP